MELSLSLRVIVERGALSRLPSVLRSLRPGIVSLFTDDVVWDVVGRDVSQILEDEGFEVYTHLVGPSTYSEFERGRGVVREVEAQVVVGLGGGRVVDAAKYAAFKEGVKFISAPTSVSHDGIASPIVSFKGEDGRPISIFTRPPELVIADLAVISRAPRRLLASGFADIVGKITSTRDALLAYRMGDRVSLYAIELASTALRIAVKHADEIARLTPRGLEALVMAAITCGISMVVDGSSRPASGSEHLFSHALDIVYPEKRSLHGEQVGIGTIMMSHLHGLNWRKVRRLLRKVGAPTNAEELGVPPEAIVEALAIAHKVRERYTILGTRGLSPEAAERLASKTLVI
ncbi:MAG TPA: iron-containing alcohol dehydrogenase [Thermofilaceae archaeon]|nr:iron-containing alcohol dehydrogenase [Thermofilaceae archaeon]